MNIKDFAHYYIGQRCLNTWFSEEHPNYNPGWVLTGFDRDAHKPFKLETEEDFTWTASIKLVLRRLEDMTEDEIAYWWASVKRDDEKLDYAEWVTEINGEPCEGHWTLWSDNKYGGVRHGYTVGINNHFTQEQFHYLLKQGFDLFNLIEKGLAVDIKNIQPPQM